MRRAVLMFDGPPRNAKHCEGCALWEAAKDDGDTCPIWGTLYQEKDGAKAGLLCRADACIDNEVAVADHDKRDSVWFALERGP